MFPKDASIIVADDMASVRTLVKGHLKALGYTFIYEAADGQECLRVMNQRREEGHLMSLVVLDWNMPHMTGIQVVEFMRTSDIFKNVPVIFLTSESERNQVTRAIISGVNQYIVKPFSPKTLEDKMKSVYKSISQAKSS